MSDAPQLLLAHHLKALKLPTLLREHDRLARHRVHATDRVRQAGVNSSAFEVAIGHAAWGGIVRLGLGGRRRQLGHGLDLHVAVLQLPLVVLLEQHGADQSAIEAS